MLFLIARTKNPCGWGSTLIGEITYWGIWTILLDILWDTFLVLCLQVKLDGFFFSMSPKLIYLLNRCHKYCEIPCLMLDM
jgi:hypothetical protein